jgi:alkylhydroperoxidase family enzyme
MNSPHNTALNDLRIQPLQPPYPAEVQADFDRIMRGRPPLRLFRTVARNPRVLSRMIAGGLLDRGSISIRLRELMILRTTARCGAEYEWGVHVAAYGGKAAWTASEIRATVRGHVDDWSAPAERAVVALADALHEGGDIDDALWSTLRCHYEEAQLIELIMLAGLYRAVSYLAKGLRIEHEAGTPHFPSG